MPKPIPDGYTSLTPSLIVDDGPKALEFYKKAFGAKEVHAMRWPGSSRIMHAELEIFGSKLMFGDEWPEMKAFGPRHYGGTAVSQWLYVEDCDKVFEQAVKAGASAIMPPADMFWGDRMGKLKDPFGHEWSIATHKKDLTFEQIKEAEKSWLERLKKGPTPPVAA